MKALTNSLKENKMKTKLAALMFLVLGSVSAFATSDGLDRVHLVVAEIQDEETFTVERAPIVGCYGLAQGARLVAWVTEYKATQNVGCGGQAYHENINALSCATIVDSKESADYSSFSEITLDISKCHAKNNAQFITMIRTTAKRNFPQGNGKEVVLKLIK
jgi:hypothetical protein